MTKTVSCTLKGADKKTIYTKKIVIYNAKYQSITTNLQCIPETQHNKIISDIVQNNMEIKAPVSRLHEVKLYKEPN